MLSEVGSYLHTVGLGSEEPGFSISADYGSPDGTLNQTSPNKELTLTSCCHAPLEFTAAAHVLFNRLGLGFPFGLFGVVLWFSGHLSGHAGGRLHSRSTYRIEGGVGFGKPRPL